MAWGRTGIAGGGAALLAALAGGAWAWETRVGPVCEMTHATAGATWRVTYDPAVPEYAIAIRLTDGTWSSAPVFALRFDGGRALTISTARHVVSPDGRTLRVTDRGFGNVLAGLEGNATATAVLGGQTEAAGLRGPRPAAPAVAAFRACVVGGLA